MTSWDCVDLRQLVTLRKGASYESRYLDLEGPPLVGLGCIVPGGGLRMDDARSYAGPVSDAHRIHGGDMVLALTDLTQDGRVLGSPGVLPEEASAIYSLDVARVEILDHTVLDRDYLYYSLRTPRFRAFMGGLATGTTVRRVAAADVGLYPLPLPSGPAQRDSVVVLKALDAKIASNQRLQRGVIALLREAFDRMMRRRGAEGSAGSDEWREENLGDWLEVMETGSRPPGGVARFMTGVPSVGAESIVELAAFDFTKTKFVPPEFFASMKRGVVRDRDVLLYKDGGRPGEFEPHVSMLGEGFPFREFALNEHVYRLRARTPVTQEYLYLWLSSEPVLEAMRRLGTGVAIPGLNSSSVRSLPLIVPPREELTRFSALAHDLVSLALGAAREARVLAELLDALGPRMTRAPLAPGLITAIEGAL